MALLQDGLGAIRAACERFHAGHLDAFGSDVDVVKVVALENRSIGKDVIRTTRVLYAA